MSAKQHPTNWTLRQVPDPDVFGDQVYSWKFFFGINVPMMLGFFGLMVFTPLREWTKIHPHILFIGGIIQMGLFASVLMYGYRRINPAFRELITYVGNLAAAVSLPLAIEQPLYIVWVLYLIVVFFEAFGNPKSVVALALTMAAPWATVVGTMGGPLTQEKVMVATLMTAMSGVVYLLVSSIAGWTREGAVAKAERAKETGALEERARLERTLDLTLGSALAEIALWHEVAVASDVVGAHAAPLAKARARAREAITELRSLVAGIDNQPANMAGLAGEIQRRAGNLCREAGVEFEFQIGMIGDLSLSDAYNTAMIAIESVENALTHASPRRIVVMLSGSPLGVTIEDDGIGFDPANMERGRGFRNLEQLAKALKAPLEITSMPGQGTRVRVFTSRRAA